MVLPKLLHKYFIKRKLCRFISSVILYRHIAFRLHILLSYNASLNGQRRFRSECADLYLMLLSVDSEGPDHTALIRRPNMSQRYSFTLRSTCALYTINSVDVSDTKSKRPDAPILGIRPNVS